jgi:hypothetical protein
MQDEGSWGWKGKTCQQEPIAAEGTRSN